MTEKIRNITSHTLSEGWSTLKRYRMDYHRRDGAWQTMEREVYDRGDGAVVLPYDLASGIVVLTRQFRVPVFFNGVPDGMFVEAPAGILDGADPAQRIRDEAMEETGYRLKAPEFLFDLFMSPGSVSERLHFYIAEIDQSDQLGQGGGLVEEAEDIEVLAMDFKAALQAVASGDIRDAKTVILLQHLRLRALM